MTEIRGLFSIAALTKSRIGYEFTNRVPSSSPPSGVSRRGFTMRILDTFLRRWSNVGSSHPTPNDDGTPPNSAKAPLGWPTPSFSERGCGNERRRNSPYPLFSKERLRTDLRRPYTTPPLGQGRVGRVPYTKTPLRWPSERGLRSLSPIFILEDLESPLDDHANLEREGLRVGRQGLDVLAIGPVGVAAAVRRGVGVGRGVGPDEVGGV